MRILHLSDLHIGEYCAFNNSRDKKFNQEVFANSVLDSFKDNGLFANRTPEMILFSGDIASKGSEEEISTGLTALYFLADKLNIPNNKVIYCPGNHDIDWDSSKETYKDQDPSEVNSLDKNRCNPRKLRNYVKELSILSEEDPSCLRPIPHWNKLAGADDIFSVHKFQQNGIDLVVYNLNSCVIESHFPQDHYGYVGETQLEEVRKIIEGFQLNTETHPNLFQILQIHHPFLAPDEHDGSALRDPLHLRNFINTFNIDLVIHGHQHFDHSYAYQDEQSGFLTVSAGSLGATRSHQPDGVRTFNLIELSGLPCNKITLDVAEYKSSQKKWRQGRSETRKIPRIYDKAVFRREGLQCAWQKAFDLLESIESKSSQIKVEGYKDSINVYVEALDQVNELFYATSSIDSTFWVGDGRAKVVSSNLNLANKSIDSKRVFLIQGDLSSYALELVQSFKTNFNSIEESQSMLKELEALLKYIRTVSENIETKFISVEDSPSWEYRSFHPSEHEIALYDAFRLDVFTSDPHGEIGGVEVMFQSAKDFNVYKEAIQTWFQDVFTSSSALPINVLLDEIQSKIDIELERIDYDKMWISVYLDSLNTDHEIFKEESTILLQQLKKHMSSLSLKNLDPHLDIGVSTGRIPSLLKNHQIIDNISCGLDIDYEVKDFIERCKSNIINFNLTDIRDTESIQRIYDKESFQIVTCFFGTASHFGLNNDGFTKALKNMMWLAGKNSILCISVWKKSFMNSELIKKLYPNPKDLHFLTHNRPTLRHFKPALEGVDHKQLQQIKGKYVDFFIISA